MLEDVLTAYIPFLTGLFITGAHFHLVFVWFFIRVIGVAEGHSGYCFKNTIFDRIGLANASAAANHDFHHTRNRWSAVPQKLRSTPLRRKCHLAPLCSSRCVTPAHSPLAPRLRSGNFGHPMYDWLFGTMDVYLAAGGEAGYIEMGRKANAAANAGVPSASARGPPSALLRSSPRVARQQAGQSL